MMVPDGKRVNHMMIRARDLYAGIVRRGLIILGAQMRPVNVKVRASRGGH
jgi:hypothetical protein